MLQKFNSFITILLLLNNLNFGLCDVMKRVINGVDAPSSEFLWAVSLKGDIHKEEAVVHCGATIIDKQWLISAAHCFFDENDLRNGNLWHARVGSKVVETEYENDKESLPEISVNPEEFGEFYEEDLTDWEIFLNNFFRKEDFENRNKRNTKKSIDLHLEKIIVHNKYTKDDAEWDIALMKLKKPIDESLVGASVKILDLPDSDLPSREWPREGQVCTLVGWGCRKKGGDVTEVAQLINLTVVTNRFCERIYEQGAGLNRNHEFCAGSHNAGFGVCAGDSGSGLVCKNPSSGKWFLAGIASATHFSRPQDFPGLFTRVSFFMPWIRSTMAEN